MSLQETEEEKTQMHGQQGHEMTEAEAGAVCTRAEDCWATSSREKQEGPSPGALGRRRALRRRGFGLLASRALREHLRVLSVPQSVGWQPGTLHRGQGPCVEEPRPDSPRMKPHPSDVFVAFPAHAPDKGSGIQSWKPSLPLSLRRLISSTLSENGFLSRRFPAGPASREFRAKCSA